MYPHRLIDMEGKRLVTHLMGRYSGPEGRARALRSGRAYVLIDGQPYVNGKPFTGRIESAYGAVAHYMDGQLIGHHQTIRSLHVESQELIPFPCEGIHTGWAKQARASEIEQADRER